ncbi:MAG: YraN family protein [Nitrospirae bacterium]|nr:YraN family protein [Nitrospirota bacterium]
MKRQIGNKGEELAFHFLKKKGMKILNRNYRTPAGEIDIIAKDGNTLVFVEVKTRSGDLFGQPVEAISPKKKKTMERASLHYILKEKQEGRPARFDVVSIRILSDKNHIEHLKDAFEIKV